MNDQSSCLTHCVMPPPLSVLMSVYNGERYLASSLDTLLDQTFKDFELLIADDRSTDRTREILMLYAAKDSRIRILDGSREGLGVVRNLLVSAASAPLIAWLDADDLAYPTRLQKQMRFMQDNPEIVAAGTSVRVIDEDGAVIKTDIRPGDHESIDSELIEYRHNAIFFPSSIVRADALDQVGGFRNEFPVGCDTDLWLRLAEIGKLANLPEILLDYRWHAESNSWKVPHWQRERAMLAINDARRRRGMEALPSSLQTASHAETPRCKIHDTWSAVALHSGNPATARKHAWKSLRLNLTLPRPWKTLALAYFPLEDDRTRPALARPFVSAIRRVCFAVSRWLDSHNASNESAGSQGNVADRSAI
ncbi:glycosyltransferase [Stieleria sp. ICT_E10.1]|uniref:glycosyltransferase family 2 protein n=1 Tax=Stieleria sedimenti TaxID=2976331 RepID=UPI00218069AA|nr:glycosyltransferase [Stieleria sedimenti]MCS7469419.1 glycosyltransferase [Stieleria sedimenti]